GAPSAGQPQPNQFLKNLQFAGGPGMEKGSPQQEGNPNDRPVSGEDAAARRAEALEIVREINKTEDPETKQYLRGLLKSIGPFDGVASSFAPRGNPVPQSQQDTEVRDFSGGLSNSIPENLNTKDGK